MSDSLQPGFAVVAPMPGLLSATVGGVADAAATGLGWLRLPFDTTRAQYARAVQSGLVERSMLASRDFEGWLGALEQVTLGPLARRV